MTMSGGPLKFAELLLEDGNNLRLWGGGLRFVGLDGSGIPPIRRLTERSALQHGVMDRGFRLDARRMTLQLATDLQNESQLDGMKDRVAGAFGPTDNPLKLKITRDDGEIRQIDCFVDGEIDFAMSQRTGTLQHITIPLLAPDPIWYNPTQQTESVAITDGNASHLTPSIVGWTWEEWPIITLTGPLDANYSVRILPAGFSLAFSSALPAGESIEIDCRPNHKTILKVSDSTNKLSYLDPDTVTNFAYMKLLPPKATLAIVLGAYSTVNFIYVLAAAGTTGASTLSATWYKRYLSL